AIAGDFAFVGEPGGFSRPGNPPAEGAVWIFRRGATAAWRHAATLVLPADAPSAGFGTALAAEGNLLLVGHVAAGGSGPTAAAGAPGMVHASVRGADGNYASAGTLPAPDVAGSQCGAALAIAGDMAYVGAPGEGSGVVHVFRRTTTGWADAGTLRADGLDAEAAFGSAIAVAGNRIAVGAPGLADKGGVFVFARATAGSYTLA